MRRWQSRACEGDLIVEVAAAGWALFRLQGTCLQFCNQAHSNIEGKGRRISDKAREETETEAMTKELSRRILIATLRPKYRSLKYLKVWAALKLVMHESFSTRESLY